MVALEVLLFITFLVIFLTGFFKWKYSYWKNRNLPYLQPRVPFGNIPNPFRLEDKPGMTLTRLYTEMKSRGWKHGGIYVFTTAMYLVTDLNYVKNILAKEFEYFNDRGIYYNEQEDPISAHVLFIGGPRWKTLRAKLNPTFTSSRIKIMFSVMKECAENMLRKIDKNDQCLDIYDILSSFTIDNISSCVFGLKIDIEASDVNSDFQIFINNCTQASKLRLMIIYLASLFPKVAKSLGFRHYSKDVSTFFTHFVSNSVKYRQERGRNRDDFLQLLLDLRFKNELSIGEITEEGLTIEEITAQCFVFFVAGFETSALTMTFALYEVARNQQVQDRVRDEINAVVQKYPEGVSYEAIMELKYLSQIIDETLRKYPPALYLTRKCTRSYKIPDDNVTIEKGTIVIIPIYGIHYDQEYYPDPQKFDPDRFNDVNRSFRHNYAYLPFGEGPRTCIGKRFGLLQVKLGLVSLLKNYNFTINEKTTEPLKFKVNSTVVKPEGKIWLDVHRVKGKKCQNDE